LYAQFESGKWAKVPAGFPVEHLDAERLLREWRWLCPGHFRLLARNAFGDLFLAHEDGWVIWLDVAAGKLKEIAQSDGEFWEKARKPEFAAEWFAENDERAFVLRGFVPDPHQCIAFATPLVFKEAARSSKPFLVDLYEGVSFLGDLHRQLRDLPDGGQVRLRIEPPPS
jgi:hypothetical protein